MERKHDIPWLGTISYLSSNLSSKRGQKTENEERFVANSRGFITIYAVAKSFTFFLKPIFLRSYNQYDENNSGNFKSDLCSILYEEIRTFLK